MSVSDEEAHHCDQLTLGFCRVEARLGFSVGFEPSCSNTKSVPANFGEAAARTLKADEWQTLGTIYLPLALISFWGDRSPHGYEASRFHAYLAHTMLLISAVMIVCKHTASERCSHDFLQCITHN